MPMHRRQLLRYSAAASVMPLLSACGEGEETKVVEKPDLSPEQLAFSSGDPEAKVVMQEFLSLTCPHCARFHNTGYPMMKERFIDAGKMLLVYRDFPLDGMALRAAMLVRALPPELGVRLQYILLEQQVRWSNREGDLTNLAGFARVAGLSPTQIEEIFADEEQMNVVIASRQQAVDKYGISATPSFVIGSDLFGGGGFEDVADWASGYMA